MVSLWRLLTSASRNAIQYRRWLLLLLIISNGTYSMWMVRSIPVPLNDLADVPDISLVGYSTIELKTWYDAIGIKGRTEGYRILALIDFVCIIPSYWLLLTSQLLQRQCQPTTLCLLVPTIAVIFDIFETSVHFWVVSTNYPHSIPNDTILMASSSATRYKFLYLALSILLVLYVTIRRRPLSSSSSSVSVSHQQQQQDDKNNKNKIK